MATALVYLWKEKGKYFSISMESTVIEEHTYHNAYESHRTLILPRDDTVHPGEPSHPSASFLVDAIDIFADGWCRVGALNAPDMPLDHSRREIYLISL